MYIKKITDFLSNYKNYGIRDFLQILEYSNIEKFDKSKFEKDFLLTLILIKFGEKYPDLVFKGGTCLNKIYFPYFRLSEDLDFVLNLEVGRTARQTLLKKYEEDFVSDLSILGFKLRDERTKFDEHKLAMFTFEYFSVINNSPQTIKIDISIKNKLYLEIYTGEIKSNFKDPILEEDIFRQHNIKCIDIKEAVAEKLRAGLTRKESAIRDFFDIWFIKNNSAFDFEDE
ncbi:MAG: nucleotidyl transferase AbiEii/AbiGii toxin family protein [Candidatus Gracilibacteria bacterium]|nr:nucleotidyl transferase AbiEii/AbiGii toxin family protein [Candidatus Gracilibacteria bacterium]